MGRKLLVGIDVQKDFVEGGALPYGYPEQSNTQKVIDFIAQWEKEHGDTDSILLTKDTHGEDFENTLEGQKILKHCIKGTDGWQIADYESKPTNYGSDGESKLEWFCDEVIQKMSFGTFQIAQWIKEFEEKECEKIDEILMVGYDMAICVLANAIILRAAFPNKRIVVLKDYCGCIDKDTFDAAVTILKCQMIEVV